MPLPKVVVYSPLPSVAKDRLTQFAEIVEFEHINEENEAAFKHALTDADGLLGVGKSIPNQWLDLAPNLKVVSTISAGIDHFDVRYLSERQIALMHTPTAVTETTADTTFLLMMGAARRASELDRMVRNGEWTKPIEPTHFGLDIHGKSLGIIGMGRIGTSLARRARFGFDMPIYYHNRRRHAGMEQTLSATYLELDDLLARCDFIVMLTPLTEASRHLMGAREFSLMKPSAVFVNVARGLVVDEDALVNALKEKKIAAAGLDVFATEPLPASSPLCSLDNTFLLPHVGSATLATRTQMAESAVNNLIKALKGELKLNCANAQELQSRSTR